MLGEPFAVCQSAKALSGAGCKNGMVGVRSAKAMRLRARACHERSGENIENQSGDFHVAAGYRVESKVGERKIPLDRPAGR